MPRQTKKTTTKKPHTTKPVTKVEPSLEETKLEELHDKEYVPPTEKEKFMEEIKKMPDGATTSDARDEEHKFWRYEPVIGTGVVVPKDYNHPIQEDLTVDKISKVPANLPREDMKYVIVDIDDEKEMDDVYNLLAKNYVEDDDATLRFDYKIDFIKWCLKVPNYQRNWFIGIRLENTNELIGFITGVPSLIKIYDKKVPVAEINFLCIKKEMRKFKLAPLLIKEVTRQVHLYGIFQAVYTSGTDLPNVVSTAQYFHRPLNPKKLDAIGFSSCNERLTMQRAVKLYKLPDEPVTPGFRRMEVKDAKEVTEKLNIFLQRHHDLTVLFDEETVIHSFMTRENIVESFVIERDGKIVAFSAYYILPSSILNSYEYKELYVAYQYYYFYEADVDAKAFFKDMLICANKSKCDVFNCLNLSQNTKYIADLLFVPGSGYLKYYLYNWACPKVNPDKLDIILQ
ncbi:N-myristoyl transferase, putative [Entamoeba invadens IP1]|uniref:Glycylpeptide N-tetradecanoyltransferase n=2 Tax=Entamoeba invadens TaxID=33085 RepID=A0A0A1U023_ENTIV|nr:N-myristoyl transferase, putative [Entamoeba invadens IP1]BAN40753.1 N-myristoyl transferase, putative [Entamoeba invadens]ELP85821.1 N-myristoyl transferase, putative [Entamoeba invadens IP1]BAN41573.1 N-myristoyl transferase, putative [Entamoeba invadens]BAN41620.1 N-myristoyl transferase, putative [Entamoeba invadens]BAN41875.1 N-myristoyl transferase, putative [Entamoeba invadens]|eukprot:XP_004185167.1 N-myristoyl transferase, putative [Entamoeba invadens IP1]